MKKLRHMTLPKDNNSTIKDLNNSDVDEISTKELKRVMIGIKN
jgi:hypothetical protein